MNSDRPRPETLDRAERERQRHPNATVSAYSGKNKLSGTPSDIVYVEDPKTGLPIKFIDDNQMEEDSHPDD